MPILADYHLHSTYSGDCNTPMEQTILSAIQKGLKYICFTEHMDFDFPYQSFDKPGMFEVNVDSYLYELLHYNNHTFHTVGIPCSSPPFYKSCTVINSMRSRTSYSSKLS